MPSDQLQTFMRRGIGMLLAVMLGYMPCQYCHLRRPVDLGPLQ